MSSEKTRTPRSIEKLDKSFGFSTVKQKLRWIDAFDDSFALRGLAWPMENRKARNFHRFPDRVADRFSLEVQELSRCPSSAFLSFFTDSSTIAVRIVNKDLEAFSHMPLTGMSGAELFMREAKDWLPIAVAVPPLNTAGFEQILLTDTSREMREYRLYLPLYKDLESLSLGLSPRAKVRPSPIPSGVKPIIFYGTSITQGGCANTTGSDFVSILGRQLETEVINFGFSGNGYGEPEMAELISKIDAEIFVLDYAANCSAERLKKTLPEFTRILRKKHPVTPILLLGPVCFNRYLWDKGIRDISDGRREEMMRFYLHTRKKGDQNIHFVDGFGLIPPGVTGSYVDGIHPTNAGFLMIAAGLTPHFHAIRIWSRSERPNSITGYPSL